MKSLNKKVNNMYKNENDNELLYLISENNEDAKDVFYEKYKEIIEIKAKKYANFLNSKGYELGDLVQEGMIGLSQAIVDFKEQKNVQFSTFANICIDRQMYSFIRNITRDKHKVLNDSISIDTTTDTSGRPLIDLLFDDKNINPEDSFIEMEEKNELFNKVKDVLTESEYNVFELRMQGFTYKEIGILLNMTPKAVDGCISRIKNKVQNIIKSTE